MTKARQYFYGGVPRTSLQTSINDTDEVGLNIVIGASEASSWPTVGPFVIRLERGTVREEAIRCSSRSGTNLVVTDRGYDGTTATAHTAGSAVYIEHTVDAAWMDAIDAILATATTAGDLLVSNGSAYARLPVGANGRVPIADSGQAVGMRWGVDPAQDLISAAGDLLYGSAADTAARLPVGTTAYPLTVVGGLPAWAQLSGAGLANDAVDSQHYVDGSIDTAHIGDLQVTEGKIADGSVTSAKLASGVAGGLAGVLDYNGSLVTVINTTTPTTLGQLDISSGVIQVGDVLRGSWFGSAFNDTGANRLITFDPVILGQGVTEPSFEVVASSNGILWEYEWEAIIGSLTSWTYRWKLNVGRQIGGSSGGWWQIYDGTLTNLGDTYMNWGGGRSTVDLTSGTVTSNMVVTMATASADYSTYCESSMVSRLS